MRQKSSLNSELFLQKKRNRRTKALLLIFFSILFIISLLIIVSRLSIFQINTVSVQGVKSISEVSVKDFIQDELSGAYFSLIPKKSFFVVKKEALLTGVQTKFPSAEEVDIKIKPRSIDIILNERSPAYLVCAEESVCYYADKKGFIFEQAPTIEGFLYKKFFGGNIEVSKVYEYSSAFSFAEEADKLLLPLGEKIIRVVTDNKRESRFYTKTGVGIIWSPEKESELGVKNLRALLYYSASGKPKTEEELKEFFSTLDYIDIRFSGKVYFKNK